MAIGDQYVFTAYWSVDDPVVGDIFGWQFDGDEGPMIDPFFELISFTDGLPATFIGEQLSEGALPSVSDLMTSDIVDDGGYGGSNAEWNMELTLDPELYSSEASVIRMIDFVYSSAVAYGCEFGKEYIRFYFEDAVLLDGSSNEVWIATPYQTDDLLELQYKQIGDVMWIVHPNYAPRKLSRTSATSFSLDVIPYNRGPFLTRNDFLNLDVPIPATMSFNNGTLTCDGEVFASGHVGAIFKILHPKKNTFVSLEGSGTSGNLSGQSKITFLTRGTWTGTVIVQKNDNNSGWYDLRTYRSTTDAHQNVLVTFPESDDNTQYRIVADTSQTFRGELSLENYLHEGIVKITAVTDAYNATAYPIIPVESVEATYRWAEGAWSDVRTWPAAITFFENRLILAGKRVIQTQVLSTPEGDE